MTLTQEDIRRGMTALVNELGAYKARLFLEAVSRGALDRHFTSIANAFVRQNPELVEAAAKAFGSFLGAMVTRKRRPKAAPVIEAVLANALTAGAPPERPPPKKVMLVENKPAGGAGTDSGSR